MKYTRDAPAERDDAHQELGGEAVPERRGCIPGAAAPSTARTAASRAGPTVTDGSMPTTRHASDEKLGRQPHQERGLVRRARQVRRSGAEEHVADEAQRIGDGEHAGQGDDVGKRLIHERVVVDLDGLGEEHLLGQKPVEQGNAGHGGGGDHRQGRRDRHESPEPAQATDVARAAFVIDDAGGHEQRRLEGRVVHDVEDRGDLAERAYPARSEA